MFYFINNLKPYIYIARPDHWVKHIFIVPGILIALVLTPNNFSPDLLYKIILGFISACLIASANYVINEWLDAETDRNHPEKHARPAANGLLKSRYVYLEYWALIVTGLFIAIHVNLSYTIAAILLFLSGIAYNVKPLRTKDIVYFDVISEAVNNPIRMILGWVMVSPYTIPPISLLGAYWAGGAFLMAAKRLSEYQNFIVGDKVDLAGLYRRSFKFYTVDTLIVSCFVYALTAAFGIAVFLIKYRAEFIVTFPFLVLLFSYYLSISLKPQSIAQKPEKLHHDIYLIMIVIVTCITTAFAMYYDMPLIEAITQSHFVGMRFGK